MASLALIIAILALSLGQLIRIPLISFSFSLLDPLIIIAALFHILSSLSHRTSIKNIWFLYFLIFAWLQLIIISLFTSFSPTPFLYLIRLSALLSFFIIAPKVSLTINRAMLLSLLSILIIGVVQYIFWPNLTFFDSFGWDPHLNRITAPFLDPTYTALVYVFLIIFTFPNLFLISLSYLGLALTYSRSSWLSLVAISALYSAATKRWLVLAVTIVALLITIILLPQPYGEGTKLNRTSTLLAKIQNYRQAFSLIKTNPIIGYGYNRLPFVRTDQNLTSHALSSFDNPFLTIWATTGLIGLFLFSRGIIFQLKSQTLESNLYWLAILTHSLFANSLLYTPTLFLLILLSLSPKYRK